MKSSFNLLVLELASAALVLALFILPFFSLPGYSIISNTLSDLGAQFSPNAWIMNTSFAIFGTGVIIGGWRHYSGLTFHRIILLLLGISLIMLAFFNHIPLAGDSDQFSKEDGWHSYFLGTSLLSFIILSFSSGFYEDDRKRKWIAFGTGLLSILLTILELKNTSAAGIWQRINALTIIAWLLYNFRRNEQ